MSVKNLLIGEFGSVRNQDTVTELIFLNVSLIELKYETHLILNKQGKDPNL